MIDNGPYVIICAGAILSLLIFFGFIVLMRYINYKENLLMAEKGIVRMAPEKKRGKGLLIWGILVTATGLALCLGLYPLGLMGNGMSFPFGLGPWMIAGFLPLFVGIGLVLVYIITANDEKEPGQTSAPQEDSPAEEIETAARASAEEPAEKK
ncbi:MAG: hypothetical protein GYA12_12030 [Chloroflexi bacterium]|jgi:ABC-type multidrug transport system permease subunit|nr:hypothetical protein [Chloroflexota bacterium]BCY16193.1 hypothetical protein hrd7_00420 [Leptolinea sp. HRD-7]